MDQLFYNGPPDYVEIEDRAITTEPGASIQAAPGAIWMEALPAIEGIPAGLEYLAYLDTVMVHQVKEVLEILTGWESKNKYAIRNKNGQQCYYAFEESNAWERQCCGSQRGFTMHIVDNFNKNVLIVKRELRCCADSFCGCLLGLQNICTIESLSTGLLGTVLQGYGCTNSFYNILDKDGNLIFLVDGQGCCTSCCCEDKDFTIKTPDSSVPIGSITKKWGGLLREAFTDADTFAVTFPIDLDVKLKAILLGATFLIDFVEFENNN